MELISLLIVALYIVLRGKLDGWRSWTSEFLATAAAAWACEQSCIAAYGFYQYHDVWWLTLGHVPVTVALIWPVVILSARDVATRATTSTAGAAALTAFIVLLDATLIEPVSVAAGLWSWNEPGFFHVPIIGVLGWSLFAGLWAMDAVSGSPRPLWARFSWTFGGVHLGLLLLWWGGLKWSTAPIADDLAVGCLTVLCAVLATTMLRHPRAPRIHLLRALLRLPGAMFFGWLLAVKVQSWALAVWVALVALVWIAALIKSAARPAPGGRPRPRASARGQATRRSAP